MTLSGVTSTKGLNINWDVLDGASSRLIEKGVKDDPISSSVRFQSDKRPIFKELMLAMKDRKKGWSSGHKLWRAGIIRFLRWLREYYQKHAKSCRIYIVGKEPKGISFPKHAIVRGFACEDVIVIVDLGEKKKREMAQTLLHEWGHLFVRAQAGVELLNVHRAKWLRDGFVACAKELDEQTRQLMLYALTCHAYIKGRGTTGEELFVRTISRVMFARNLAQSILGVRVLQMIKELLKVESLTLAKS